MLLVYGAYSPDRLIRKIQTREDRYDIQNTVSIDTDIEQIKLQILENGNVVLTDIPAEIRNELLKFCFDHNVRCYCVPKISDIMVRSAASIHLLDTTLLLFRNMGLTGDQKLVKRLFDIVASLIAIVIASPFMLIIAAAIRLYDGGPALFTQERLTENGKIFKLYKFRSMRVDDGNGAYIMTRKDDDRITLVGKIIRNIHFDELPQLFNILKGDMSFVGPRPECPKLAEEYRQIIPQFHYRLKVKAGLTGYAQVYGKYNTTPYDKLKLDLHYIENYSFLLDMKLMLLTFKILFQKENTEGIESWQTSAAPETENREITL
jgi:exopolysaccharide biosynthesis polyprenyl glycosylphosphotransferase